MLNSEIFLFLKRIQNTFMHNNIKVFIALYNEFYPILYLFGFLFFMLILSVIFLIYKKNEK
jgi:hypothetical protein